MDATAKILAPDNPAALEPESGFHQTEKLELVGRLALGIAHDFNNLLTGILLYSDLLLSELGPSDQLRCYVEEIRAAVAQGSAFTKELLGMFRKPAPQAGAIMLNEIVSSMRNFLGRILGKIELITELDSAGLVVADASQLRQILLNLVVNARDAVGPGGKIRISTRQTTLPSGLSRDTPRSAAALVVEDTGCGMTAETRSRMFEPFFTTKEPGGGTGLGLATVHRIVAERGGVVEVFSQPGRGTRIAVLFPAVETVTKHPETHVHAQPSSQNAFDLPLKSEGDSSCSVRPPTQP